MTTRGPDQARTLRYLLGTLPEEEAARLEREFLGDDASYEELLALEDELFHDYARGALADGDRQQFEARFLQSPDGRRRLEEARRIQAAVGSRPSPDAVPKPPGRPAWPLLAAAAAVLAAVGVVWVASRGPQAVRQAQSASPSPRPSTAVSSPSPSPRVGPASVVTLALAAGVIRGESGTRRATLRESDGALRLVLGLPPGRPGAPYRAVVRSAEGAPVWTGDGVPVPEGGAVALEVPASLLPEGDYELVLSGTSGGRPLELADYAFRILRP